MKKIISILLSIIITLTPFLGHCQLSKKRKKSKNYPSLSFGVNAGNLLIIGDITSRSIFNSPLKNGASTGFAAVNTIRLKNDRLYLHNTVLKGGAHGYNSYLTSSHFNPPSIQESNPWYANNYRSPIYNNYATDIVAITTMLVYGTGREKLISIGFGSGLNILSYSNRTNVLKPDNTDYSIEMNNISSNGGTIKQTTQDLQSLFDNTFESYGERHNNMSYIVEKKRHNILTLATYFETRVKVSKYFSIALENYAFITADDLLDGQRWTENGNLTSGYDKVLFTTMGVHYHF